MPQNKLFSFKKILLSTFIIFSIFVFSAKAHASVTPTLSTTPMSDGDNVQINVVGDTDSSVILYYTKTGTGPQINVLGSTNSSDGSFSTIISSNAYGIASGSPIHVLVGGVNGTSSPTINWPSVTSPIVNQVTLGQTSLNLSIGQTSTIVVANNNSSGTFYISSNSNPTVANTSLSGSQLNINTLAYGSTSITVCATGNTTNCPSVYVTVANPVSQSLTFSQSNVNLTTGQNAYITVSGGSGYYTVTNNTNPSLVQTIINGASITLTPSSSSGITSITVCTTDSTACGIISANVNYSSNGGPITLSQSNLTLSSNQTTTVTISGGANPYVLSTSANSTYQANINGNILNITALNSGSSQISICSSNGGSCTWLSLTVNSPTLQPFYLSQNNISLTPGQDGTVSIFGGVLNSYSATYNSNSSISSTNVSGNMLTIKGIKPGHNVIVVCDSAINCSSVSATIATTTSVVQQNTTPVAQTSNPTQSNSKYIFTKNLLLGSIGAEVSELQKRLTAEGVYSGPINGRFGPMTKSAVIKYQKNHKINPVGTLGLITRTVLNNI